MSNFDPLATMPPMAAAAPASAQELPTKNVSTFFIIAAIAALLGVFFAGMSTHDFIEHLDRQLHATHCSFIPGAGAELGENGCRVVMMSPYSSLFRDSMWGGLPISILALGVFCYMAVKAIQLAISKTITKHDTLYFMVATLLPVLMSVIYGYIAVTKIGAVCKLCVGVYISSAVLFISASLAHAQATPKTGALPFDKYIISFLEGVVYVAALTVLFIAIKQEPAQSVKGCGSLVQKDDPAGVFLTIGKANPTGTPTIAVLDPLCPACKAFDERIAASDLPSKLNMQVVLFPLDSSCNWNVKTSLHPGACAVSEAMLCAKEKAPETVGTILDWAMQNQEKLRADAKEKDDPVRAQLEQQFPAVKGCLGGTAVKNKLNKSLRWAVANALAVTTPQLFINGKRVCDEDTDLGLEYTVTQMLQSK